MSAHDPQRRPTGSSREPADARGPMRFTKEIEVMNPTSIKKSASVQQTPPDLCHPPAQ